MPLSDCPNLSVCVNVRPAASHCRILWYFARVETGRHEQRITMHSPIEGFHQHNLLLTSLLLLCSCLVYLSFRSYLRTGPDGCFKHRFMVIHISFPPFWKSHQLSTPQISACLYEQLCKANKFRPLICKILRVTTFLTSHCLLARSSLDVMFGHTSQVASTALHIASQSAVRFSLVSMPPDSSREIQLSFGVTTCTTSSGSHIIPFSFDN